MLSIKPIGSSKSQVLYYATLGKEDYYIAGGEPPGSWWGKGANSLGQRGNVTPGAFGNILRGYSANGESTLVQNAGVASRRSGFDLTFSAPKSVSIAWSQAKGLLKSRIEVANERALKRTLELFHEYCGRGRRGRNGAISESADLVCAVFRHETARAIEGHLPDPNLHFHVVVCNVVVRPDGSTGAFDANNLFSKHMKMALGGLYRAQLSKELSKIGLQSHRPELPSGNLASWFELDAIPKELIDEFSKRRVEVQSWMQERGLAGAKAAEQAALNTRLAKEDVDRTALHSSWQTACQKHGLSQEALIKRLAKPTASISPGDAVESALSRISEGSSHFSRIELIRFTAEEAQGHSIGIDAIHEAVKQTLIDDQRVVSLGNERYTTREMFELERSMLAAVKRLSNIRSSESEKVEQHIARFPTIREEQAKAVRQITKRTGAVQCVNGLAGTGKTFMLQIAKDIWADNGQLVLGTTLSAKASQVLESESGIESVHLARLFWEIETGKRSIDSKSVVVLDEAGMVGTRQMASLVDLVEKANAKLVLVGDHRQLQAVDAGGPFRAIAKRVGYVEMQQIARQREKWARKSVSEFAMGDVYKALQRYAEHGLLEIADDGDQAMQGLVRAWQADPADLNERLIFAGTRREVASLNRLCQQTRLEAGELRQQSISVDNEKFHVGDRVVFCKNNASLFVKNGSYGFVNIIDSNRREMTVRLDDGINVRIDLRSYSDIKLGYAVTTHKGQGMTVESAFVLAGGPMTDREISYVQSSRARGKTKIYSDVISGGEDVAALAKSMGRSRRKDLAHDLLLENG